ncbi:hypothetical protein BV898_13932 [Hypsibius exemplaris]|uniref:Protein sleepless n=1 Tax=Hypsibius exemplaris TaxID=2072580 RepID=A0A1W0W948_HYPEX|nr:hypothetical protein BV898_13932 [Hypsibius exemplaris]
MKFWISVVVAFAVVVVPDFLTTTDAAELPAVIQEPGKDFRGDVFSCHVCHSNMPHCGNRVDCCVTPTDDEIQACPTIPSSVCFKTQTYDGTFYNVTRGCGKKFANGPLGQTDSECQVIGSDQNNIVCNCIGSECNAGTQVTLSAFLIVLLSLLPLMNFFKNQL